jgi:hypothetical protein
VYRNPAVNPKIKLNFTQGFNLNLNITDATGLGECDEGETVTGNADKYLHVLPPVRMRYVVDAGADPIEQVICRHNEVGGHFSVFTFCPGMGAIFTVASDIENWPKLFLQEQGFPHQLFRAGVMVDRRKNGKRLFASKENGLGMTHIG